MKCEKGNPGSLQGLLTYPLQETRGNRDQVSRAATLGCDILVKVVVGPLAASPYRFHQSFSLIIIITIIIQDYLHVLNSKV